VHHEVECYASPLCGCTDYFVGRTEALQWCRADTGMQAWPFMIDEVEVHSRYYGSGIVGLSLFSQSVDGIDEVEVHSRYYGSIIVGLSLFSQSED
jgi:hypothetical protein